MHAQSPKLMSAPSTSTAKEQQESVAHEPDTEGEKNNSRNVGFTYASACEEFGNFKDVPRREPATSRSAMPLPLPPLSAIAAADIESESTDSLSGYTAAASSACAAFPASGPATSLRSESVPRAIEDNGFLLHLECKLTKLRETRDQLVGVNRAHLSPHKVTRVCGCVCVCVLLLPPPSARTHARTHVRTHATALTEKEREDMCAVAFPHARRFFFLIRRPSLPPSSSFPSLHSSPSLHLPG